MARSLLIAMAFVGMALVANYAEAGRRGGCSGGSCGVVYSAAPAPAMAAAPAQKTEVVAASEAAPVRATTVSSNYRTSRIRLFGRRR